jgi:hypothetical protein
MSRRKFSESALKSGNDDHDLGKLITCWYSIPCVLQMGLHCALHNGEKKEFPGTINDAECHADSEAALPRFRSTRRANPTIN